MISNGIDNLKDWSHVLEDKRIGIITNPSGANTAMESTADILAHSFNVTALFGPEHGIRGDAQAGIGVDDDRDPVLNIPAFSLHGKTNRISDEQFQRFDTLVYDIQDIGVRFYTYIYTLAYAMEDAARNKRSVVVLDRINPLGGTVTEGIIHDHDNFKSFVGLYPIPARYALTVGEYAHYINETFNINCDLTVVPCTPHDRATLFPQTGQLWISPSPNIPTFESALAYIGTCIFEGTNISEGRGTTHPFEIIGAPFIDANKLVQNLNKHKLPGIVWRPAHFTPTFSKFANQLCHGVQLHIADPTASNFFEAGVWLYHEIKALCEKDMTPPTRHFSLILGDEPTAMDNPEALIQRAKQDSQAFLEATQKYRLY